MDSARAIENLLYRYAELIDGGDLEGVARLFAHGEILAPAATSGAKGYDAVLAMYRSATRIYPETGTPRTRHVTSNAIIEVDETAGRATARSYFTVFQATEGFALQPIIAGRYHDLFERHDGEWRFRERRMLPDLWGDLSKHLLYDASAVGA
jgi:3-phenylpropionate/cinnamic acid dioxygenase small subunit